MDEWKLWFVLLPALTVCVVSGVTLLKTVGREPDFTPVCSEATLDSITLIVCEIRTESSREVCRLLYQYENKSFVQDCDSRFRLVTHNQTVVLKLSGLTPVDRGNCSCQCSYQGGTDILHIIITVADEDVDGSAAVRVAGVVIGVAVFVILAGTAFGFVHRKIHHREYNHHASSSTDWKPPEPLNVPPSTELLDIEPYSTFMQKENGLYSAYK